MNTTQKKLRTRILRDSEGERSAIWLDAREKQREGKEKEERKEAFRRVDEGCPSAPPPPGIEGYMSKGSERMDLDYARGQVRDKTQRRKERSINDFE